MNLVNKFDLIYSQITMGGSVHQGFQNLNAIFKVISVAKTSVELIPVSSMLFKLIDVIINTNFYQQLFQLICMLNTNPTILVNYNI